jgi:hypothetical protein
VEHVGRAFAVPSELRSNEQRLQIHWPSDAPR